jgi:hypothetical protein
MTLKTRKAGRLFSGLFLWPTRSPQVVLTNGAPRRTRTSGLLIRSQTLYPAELWVHRVSFKFQVQSFKSSRYVFGDFSAGGVCPG